MRIRGLTTYRRTSNTEKPIRPIAKKRFETPAMETQQEKPIATVPEPVAGAQEAEAPCIDRDEHYTSFIMDFLGPFLR